MCTQAAEEAKTSNVSVYLSQVDNDHQAQAVASVVAAKVAVGKAQMDNCPYLRPVQASDESKTTVPPYPARINTTLLGGKTTIGVLRVDIDALQKRSSPLHASTYDYEGWRMAAQEHTHHAMGQQTTRDASIPWSTTSDHSVVTFVLHALPALPSSTARNKLAARLTNRNHHATRSVMLQSLNNDCTHTFTVLFSSTHASLKRRPSTSRCGLLFRLLIIGNPLCHEVPILSMFTFILR